MHSLLQLHYLNNQQIFLSYQNFFQQHSHFKVTTLIPGFSQLLPITNLPTQNLYSLNILYHLSNKSKNFTSIQIDFREILALINIHNITTSQTTSLSQPQISLSLYDI